jgi:hypothetical protein
MRHLSCHQHSSSNDERNSPHTWIMHGPGIHVMMCLATQRKGRGSRATRLPLPVARSASTVDRRSCLNASTLQYRKHDDEICDDECEYVAGHGDCALVAVERRPSVPAVWRALELGIVADARVRGVWETSNFSSWFLIGKITRVVSRTLVDSVGTATDFTTASFTGNSISEFSSPYWYVDLAIVFARDLVPRIDWITSFSLSFTVDSGVALLRVVRSCDACRSFHDFSNTRKFR